MNIVKPVYVYKWVNSKQSIKYVFDPSATAAANAPSAAAADASIIVIKEPIYQDSSKEDAMNKIAYYINNAATAGAAAGADKTPYYAWINKEPFLFDITGIKWKGYDINPFKSTDRKADDINSLHKDYAKSKELFETTDGINIVLKSDFNEDIKHYYNNIRFKCNNYRAATDQKVGELYKVRIANTKKVAEEYSKVVFAAKIPDMHSLVILFDKLSATREIQLIQYITSLNKAFYKLYKRHTFKNRKELSRIFKEPNDTTNKDKEYIKIYATKRIFITIYPTGIIHLTFNYQIDRGAGLADILKQKDKLNEYINKVLNINIVFKEKYVNARIRYNVYKATTESLRREVGTSTIFVGAKDKDGKVGVFYYYKRTANYEDKRAIEIDNINKTKQGANIADILDALIIVKKEAGGFMFDVKNIKSFFEFECLEYWISRIIESSINEKQSTEPEPITAPVVPSSKGNSDSGSDSSDNIYKGLLNNYADGSSGSSGGALANDGGALANDGGALAAGGYDGDDNKNYLIKKLKIADKDIWANDNKARKCQKKFQPLPLSKEEYEDLEKRGYKFANSMVYNKTSYVCPRIWCPKSNVPLDEASAGAAGAAADAKCPLADEKPILMNNKDKGNYVYLIPNHNVPCCGKKPPKVPKEPKQKKAANAAKASPKASPTQPKSPDTPKHLPKSPKSPKSPDTPKHSAKPDNDNLNHIMKKYPIDKKDRYGDIPEELYKILYPKDYKEFLSKCSSPNNINKKKCIFRRGLINIEDIPKDYDNIINTIAYLVGETTKPLFIENVKNKMDILKYISLDNGNVCKDFGDYEPVLYEDNKRLYEDLKAHIITKNLNIVLPDVPNKDASEASEAEEYKISRLLYIYKSYITFIEYLSADNYPEDKGIQYLYSLVALVYKRLLIVWEITINTSSNVPSVDLVVPEYANDIIGYYEGLQKKKDGGGGGNGGGGDAEILMILKEKWIVNGSKEENKKNKDNKLYEIMKDRDNIYFYEPLVIKQINNAEKKHYTLSEFPNITKIINYKPANNILKHLKHLDNNIKDDTKAYRFNTIIINDNYTIDKMMLANDVIIRFKPHGTIVLPYLMKELNIKNVVFVDDIYNGREIKTINHIYATFLENINKLNKAEKTLNITVDIGEIIEINNIQTKSVHKQPIAGTAAADAAAEGQVILYGKKGVYEEYDKKNARDIKEWSRLRLLVKDRLEALLETKNNKIAEYSKKSRGEFIKWLVGLFDNGQSPRSQGKIQVILEEIPVFTKDGINNWYASTLLHTKYDYINGLSDNFVNNNDGTELIFTQFLINKNIPKSILYYHDANPRIIERGSGDGGVSGDGDDDGGDGAIVNYEDSKKEKSGSKGSKGSRGSKGSPKAVAKIPSMFEGELKVLNSKWIKYKKRIWYHIRYVKNTYTPNNIIELFNYLKALDNNLVNDYNDVIEKTFKYYEKEFNKNKDGRGEDTNKVKDVFKDPHFYTSYINAMNQVNNTKKVFKNVEFFLENYFYTSSVNERNKILSHLETSGSYVYHPNDTTFFMMSKVLNISIFIINSRVEYGKAVDVSKRADDKDLSITTTIFKAGGSGSGKDSGSASGSRSGSGSGGSKVLERPLVILYRHKDKTQLNYYIIRNPQNNDFIYTELKDAPEEIKAMVVSAKRMTVYSSSSSTQTSKL
jgi:hypothetical protein